MIQGNIRRKQWVNYRLARPRNKYHLYTIAEISEITLT